VILIDGSVTSLGMPDIQDSTFHLDLRLRLRDGMQIFNTTHVESSDTFEPKIQDDQHLAGTKSRMGVIPLADYNLDEFKEGLDFLVDEVIFTVSKK